MAMYFSDEWRCIYPVNGNEWRYRGLDIKVRTVLIDIEITGSSEIVYSLRDSVATASPESMPSENAAASTPAQYIRPHISGREQGAHVHALVRKDEIYCPMLCCQRRHQIPILLVECPHGDHVHESVLPRIPLPVFRPDQSAI